MTEYELIDLLTTLRAEVGRASMDLVTVMFGYLVCAHFIGVGLSRTFVIPLSAVYSCFAFFPMMGVMQSIYHIALVSDAHIAVLEKLDPVNTRQPGGILWMAPTFALVLFGSWAMSLGYMYRVRRASHAA